MRRLIMIGLGLLLPLSAALAAPVTLPQVKDASGQTVNTHGDVLVDSTGVDATDTTNHAVRMSCIVGACYTTLAGPSGNQAAVNASGQLSVTGPVTAGAASFADGWDATQGAKADTAWTSGGGSVVALLKAIDRDTLLPLAAGSNLIGSVTTDNVVDGATTNASVTSATTVISGNMQGYSGGSFQITSAGASNTIVFEQSNDNGTWTALTTWGGTTSAAAGSGVSTAGSYQFVSNAAFVRARVSVYGSGTVTAYLTLKRAPLQTAVSLVAGTNAIGDVGVQYRTTATGAASIASILSPATPVGASIKGSAGRVIGWTLSNSAASVRSVKFYNATSVTMGTTAAVFEVDIPAGQTVQISLDGGVGFGTGIMWAVTGAKGLTDNTGSLGANDVSGVVFFA